MRGRGTRTWKGGLCTDERRRTKGREIGREIEREGRREMSLLIEFGGGASVMLLLSEVELLGRRRE